MHRHFPVLLMLSLLAVACTQPTTVQKAAENRTAAAATVETHPPVPAPPGSDMRDIMLLYLDRNHPYTAMELRPYVSYLDKANGGKPVDWFYDSFLFLIQSGSLSGQSYEGGTTDLRDWKCYLDLLFKPASNLAALDAALAEVAQTLGAPPRPRPIILMIPFVNPRQKSFGDVDGSGRSLDFSKSEDTVAGTQWLVRETTKRFKAAGYKHLSLWGYYWMAEEINASAEPTVKAVAKVIHDHDFKFLWIPWFKAQGFDRWREHGFDLAILQPNYAFKPLPRNEQRLSDTAALCRRHQMGIEIELPYQLLSRPEERDGLTDYLDYGLPGCEGYIDGVRACFQSHRLLLHTQQSEIAANTDLYRGLYLFHKNRFSSMDRSVVKGRPCELVVPGRPACRSTTLTTRSRQNSPVRIPGSGASLWVELPTTLRVAEMRLRTDEDDVPPFFRARLFACKGRDDAGLLIADELVSESCGEAKSATGVLRCRPQPARLLRVDFSGPGDQQTALTWIRVLGAGGLHGEGNYTCDGQGATGTLADGRYALSVSDTASLVRWPQHAGTITLDTSSCAHLGKLWLHFVKTPGGDWPTKVTAQVGPSTIPTAFTAPPDGDWGAYATVDLPGSRPSQITVSFAGSGALALDEIEFEPACNLALGKPYVVEPASSAQVAVDDRKLTDGQLSNGSGDGRNIGWIRGEPIDVILDLGQSHPIDQLRAHVQGGGRGWVFLPQRVTAFTSGNGEDWSPVFSRVILPQEPLEFKNSVFRWLEINIPRTVTRFVKFSFVKSYAWMSIDELEVISDGRNVALKRPYGLLPLPSSKEAHADDGRRLTDGSVCAKRDNDLVTGHGSADLTVTVDLKQSENISLVTAHVFGGGSGGVFFPSEMSVMTSADGVAWSSAFVTREIPSETGKDSTDAWLDVKIAANARYIRYCFKRHGSCMVDEVQVFGPP